MTEASLVAPVGASTLTIAGWSFRRSAGDTTGASARNQENLGGSEVVLSVPVASWLDVEPQLAGRISFPDQGHAHFAGLGSGFRIRVSDAVMVTPSFRYDTGVIDDDAGHRVDLRGWYLSVFLRVNR